MSPIVNKDGTIECKGNSFAYIQVSFDMSDGVKSILAWRWHNNKLYFIVQIYFRDTPNNSNKIEPKIQHKKNQHVL